MLRIQRTLLGELLFMFVLVLGSVTAIVFGGFAIRFVTRGGEALGSQLMGALLPKLLPVALAYSAPFAWLAAVAFVVGRWVADLEVTALKSAGLHIRTIVLPVLALGGLLATAGMLYNTNGVATSHREVRSMLSEFLPKFLNSLNGSDRSIAFSKGRLSWERYDPETNEFVGAQIEKRRQDGRLLQQGIARGLHLEHVSEGSEEDGFRMVLTDGVLLVTRPGGDELRRDHVERMAMGSVKSIAASTGMGEFLGASRFLYRPKDMNLRELLYTIERGGVQRGSATEARIAMHGRLALGSACFSLGLFALAMALWLPPSSRRVRDFMACFGPAMLIFFPLLLAGPSLARNSPLPLWLAMWSPNVVLILLGSVLLWFAARR